MHANSVPDGFEQTLSRYLITTDLVVNLILDLGAKSHPEKYATAIAHVKSGQLVPHVVLYPGTLIVSLIDAQSGKSGGEFFRYSIPALEARGVPN